MSIKFQNANMKDDTYIFSFNDVSSFNSFNLQRFKGDNGVFYKPSRG